MKISGFFGKYRFLSNFYTCKVYYDGLVFNSSENAYQSAKLINSSDRHIFLYISAKESKILGYNIEKRKDWDLVKLNIMYNIVYDKFTRNELLGNLLLETTDSYLEETNTWNDNYWGVCNGIGKNYLGKILMDIRNVL
jgi:ribA/ribD-fused uncharacterized protein